MLPLPTPSSIPHSSFLPKSKKKSTNAFLLIIIYTDAVFWFKNRNTHTPFGGIPGCEPPSEGGRLESLLDHDDRRIWISVTRVCVQVLLACDHCFFTLYHIGLFTNPEKHLRPTIRNSRIRRRKVYHLPIKSSVSKD